MSADPSCEEDELRVSLLQSSLQLEKKASVQSLEPSAQTLEPSVSKRNAEAVREQNKLWSPYVEASDHVKMLAKKHLSLVLQMMLPTEKTALSGIPALLVFMLAGLVMALFVVQLIGVMFDDRSKEPGPQPFQPRYGYPPSTGHGTLPPMTLPNSPPSRVSMGPHTAPSTVPNLPQRDTVGSGRQSQAPNPSQMCPAMIVPHAEALSFKLALSFGRILYRPVYNWIIL